MQEINTPDIKNLTFNFLIEIISKTEYLINFCETKYP